jgi:hypothetical protein
MRRLLVLVGLVLTTAVAGCGSEATVAASSATSTTSTSLPATSGTDSSAGNASTAPGSAEPDPDAWSALCREHCEPLSLKGTSPCDSEASCDRNVADGAAAVDAFQADAEAAGIEIRSTTGFTGLFTAVDEARAAYETTSPCAGVEAGSSVPSDCFSGVANFQLAVQILGSTLERRS